MANYRELYARRATVTKQTDAIPGREAEMVRNAAGGYAFKIDDFDRLHRFLIIGSDGGSYYVGRKQLTRDNAQAVLRCLETDGVRTVQLTREISENARAPRNDPAIYVLAMATAAKDETVRREAINTIPAVCRTGTHLLTFCDYVGGFRGWGRGLRRGVGSWYAHMPLERLALQAVKYRNRSGWTHRDALNMSHPETVESARRALFQWLVKPEFNENETAVRENFPLIDGMFRAREATSATEVVRIIHDFRLPHEAVPDEWSSDPTVLDALLAHMPMEAMIRNLGNLSAAGLVDTGSAGLNRVVTQLGSEDSIRRSKVHPFKLLYQGAAYRLGHSLAAGRRKDGRAGKTWHPHGQVLDALTEAFYTAFGNVPTSNAKELYALDVSGSMDGNFLGGKDKLLSCREAAAAFTLVMMKARPNADVVAFMGGGMSRSYSFSDTTVIKRLSISPRQRLDDVVSSIKNFPLGRTDCALPFIWAEKENREYDVVTTITDNETWAGEIHPHEALSRYRRKTGRATRFVAIAMTATDYSVADPHDPLSLDVVGFDSDTPEMISAFVG